MLAVVAEAAALVAAVCASVRLVPIVETSLAADVADVAAFVADVWAFVAAVCASVKKAGSKTRMITPCADTSKP